MVISINKIFLMGQIIKNPEVKDTRSKKKMVILKLLTIERIKNNKIYNWHRIVLYNNLAYLSERLLTKGDLIFVSGRIQNRKWINENGETRYITEIIADEIKLLKRNRIEIGEQLNNLGNFDFEKNLNNKNNISEYKNNYESDICASENLDDENYKIDDEFGDNILEKDIVDKSLY